jgi:hypothetical protein
MTDHGPYGCGRICQTEAFLNITKLNLHHYQQEYEL